MLNRLDKGESKAIAVASFELAVFDAHEPIQTRPESSAHQILQADSSISHDQMCLHNSDGNHRSYPNA